MSRKIEIVGNVLAEGLNYLLLAMIEIILFLSFLKHWPQMWRIALLLVVPLFYYVLREVCANVVLFMAAHIIPVILVAGWFGSRTYERVIFAISIVFFAVLSIRKQLSGSTDKGIEAAPLPAGVGTFVVLYLLNDIVGEGEAAEFLIIWLVIYLAGYLMYAYFIRFLSYIDINQRTAENIPAARAFKTSFGLAAAFTGGSLLFVYLITNREVIEAVSSGIRSIIVTIIRFLASFLPEREPLEITIQQTPQVVGEKVTLPPAETSLLAQIMDVILTLFAFGIIGFFLISIVMGLIRLIKNASWGGSRTAQTQEAVRKDKVESLFAVDRKKKKAEKEFSLFKPKTSNQQIRLLYQKTLWQKYKVLKEEKTAKLILESTPRECCLSLFEHRKEEALKFALLYEKARYGGEICNSSEVKLMKQYAQALLGK